MKTAIADLSSLSPYSSSQVIQSPRDEERKETADAHEERCWRERIHRTADGRVFIPPVAFKMAVADAAQSLSIKIPGKGNNLYTKHFRQGILVIEPLVFDLEAEAVASERLFLHANGKRGSGTRVWRRMPLIPEWSGRVNFLILDDVINEEIFRRVLGEAGNFIGIGRFRPQNGGWYGRFAVDALEWQEMPLTQAAE